MNGEVVCVGGDKKNERRDLSWAHSSVLRGIYMEEISPLVGEGACLGQMGMN